ncbi:hypothetical protein H0H92_007537, partial [Tricholoma furcatifolium]
TVSLCDFNPAQLLLSQISRTCTPPLAITPPSQPTPLTMPSMKKTKKNLDERRLHARRESQKQYRRRNRDVLNQKARERAARARAGMSTLPPEVQAAKHAAKLEAAR